MLTQDQLLLDRQLSFPDALAPAAVLAVRWWRMAVSIYLPSSLILQAGEIESRIYERPSCTLCLTVDGIGRHGTRSKLFFPSVPGTSGEKA